MGIYIDKHNYQGKVDRLCGLFKTGKIGESITLYAGYGYKHLVFHCVKMGLKTINVYGFDRGWYNRIDHKFPIIKITEDYFQFLKGNFSHYSSFRVNREIGDWSYTFRGFLSMGIISNMELRYLRSGTLVKCNGTEIATFYPMKIDWKGNLLSRIPKKVRLFTENCHKENRRIINASARSNYGNTRIVRLIREAQATDDWNKIKPLDVFSLTNVAKRTELIEHFGMEAILDNVDHEVVDKAIIDGRKYELLRFQFPRFNGISTTTIPATYLKMINPSTDETCVEDVPNNVNSNWSDIITTDTVEQALAWRDGDKNSYIVPIALT